MKSRFNYDLPHGSGEILNQAHDLCTQLYTICQDFVNMPSDKTASDLAAFLRLYYPFFQHSGQKTNISFILHQSNVYQTILRSSSQANDYLCRLVVCTVRYGTQELFTGNILPDLFCHLCNAGTASKFEDLLISIVTILADNPRPDITDQLMPILIDKMYLIKPEIVALCIRKLVTTDNILDDHYIDITRIIISSLHTRTFMEHLTTLCFMMKRNPNVSKLVLAETAICKIILQENKPIILVLNFEFELFHHTSDISIANFHIVIDGLHSVNSSTISAAIDTASILLTANSSAYKRFQEITSRAIPFSAVVFAGLVDFDMKNRIKCIALAKQILEIDPKSFVCVNAIDEVVNELMEFDDADLQEQVLDILYTVLLLSNGDHKALSYVRSPEFAELQDVILSANAFACYTTICELANP